MKILILIASLLMLGGCATSSDYHDYARIQIANAKAEEARYKAISDTAGKSEVASALAMFTLQNANGGGQGRNIMAPKTGWEIAREMAHEILPFVGTVYTVHENTKSVEIQSNNSTLLGMRQSDNATAGLVSTNNTFGSIAGKIQAPAANVTTNTTTTTNTDSHAISGSYNPIDNQNQNNPVLTCTTGPC